MRVEVGTGLTVLYKDGRLILNLDLFIQIRGYGSVKTAQCTRIEVKDKVVIKVSVIADISCARLESLLT